MHHFKTALPYTTADLPGIGGQLKVYPEDFTVEEIPAYEPCGAGEHLFLWVQKRDLSTEQLLQHVARVLKVPARDIGSAGLKDRRAVTRQYLSVPACAQPPLNQLDTDAVHLLAARPHRHKLRTGQLRGNQFSLLIRDVTPDALEKATAVQHVLQREGMPNFFGPQRFGQDARIVQQGLKALHDHQAGHRPRKRDRSLRLSLSAVQSQLFGTEGCVPPNSS